MLCQLTRKVDGQPSTTTTSEGKTNRIAMMKAKFIEFHLHPERFLDMATLRYISGTTYQIVGQRLEDVLGAELLGAGAFAAVYGFSDKLVLKVNTHEDKGYAAFVDFCQRHRGNPHLPRVYYRGKWADRYVYILERLELGACHEEQSFLSEQIGRRIHQNETITNRFMKPDCFGPLLDDTCEALREFKNNYPTHLGWDLHGKNIMLRGDTPVITDPFVD